VSGVEMVGIVGTEVEFVVAWAVVRETAEDRMGPAAITPSAPTAASTQAATRGNGGADATSAANATKLPAKTLAKGAALRTQSIRDLNAAIELNRAEQKAIAEESESTQGSSE
jgi:uncharacterized protein (DUF2342 family)